MSNELDDVARSLFLGHIPYIWRKLAPDTLKTLGNWMLYFLRRFNQYTLWVSAGHCGGVSDTPPTAPAFPCVCIRCGCVWGGVYSVVTEVCLAMFA